MKKILFILLIIHSYNSFGQCSMGFTPSYTPETCPGCCDGKITGTISNACPPVGGFLLPGNIPWSMFCCWQNLCSGVYTVVIQGACCNAVCSVTLAFATNIKQEESFNHNSKIYPNPVLNNLFISTDQNEFENSEIEITNSLFSVSVYSY